MTKQITFIRHNILTPPYDNYDQLSLSQLAKLARNEISPSIQEFNLEAKNQFNNNPNFKSADLIIHSESVRTVQTSIAIMRSLGHEIATTQSPLLNEILFNPEELVTEQEFLQSGLKIIRPRLYQSISDGRSLENLSDLNQRITALLSLIKHHAEKNIICVSHGFFLVLLKLYFDNSLNSKALLDIPTNYYVNYLESFNIAL